MVASRRAFLERGHYAPLSDRINLRVGIHVRGNETSNTEILDAGCGEGYYLHRLRKFLPPGSDCYGLDISKEAVKRAATKDQETGFVVASIHQSLPFAQASLDVVINVFAPRNPAEFGRVLKPDGLALVVVPGEGHLAELHDALGMPRINGDKERRAVEEFGGELVLSQADGLSYRRVVPPEDVLHLIRMTPTGGQLSDEAWAEALKLPRLEIGFSFALLALRHASALNTGNE